MKSTSAKLIDDAIKVLADEQVAKPNDFNAAISLRLNQARQLAAERDRELAAAAEKAKTK